MLQIISNSEPGNEYHSSNIYFLHKMLSTYIYVLYWHLIKLISAYYIIQREGNSKVMS